MSQLEPPSNDQDHRLGSPDAPAQLVEYGDYECPFCGRAHHVVKAVQRRMGRRLLYIYRHFPLSTIHPHAQLAAEAAEAAGAQGRFWQMHNGLFENQQLLGEDLILSLAQALGLDLERFVHELKTGVYRPRVRQHFMSGVRSGVNGTPTFFINGARHDQSWDEETLIAALDRAARPSERILGWRHGAAQRAQ